MDKTSLLFFYDYSVWANARLLDAAGRTTPEQFHAPVPSTYGSLSAILAHTLLAYEAWHGRMAQGKTPENLPRPADFAGCAEFRPRFEASQAALRAYLAGLDENELERVVQIRTSKGAVYEHQVWQIVLHLLNHTTQHRSEAAEVLTQMGFSPGDLDLIWYLRMT